VTRLHVLSIGYNCGPWFERCLRSIAAQDQPADSVLVMDDASADNGYGLHALALCQDLGYTFIRNGRNRQAQQNVWTAMRFLDLDEDDIVFVIDTDDFLPHHRVFTRIREVYDDPAVWLTYGSHEFHPKNDAYERPSAYPPEVVASRSFRTHGVSRFGHPLTFRRRAWDCIEKKDLQHADGRWFTMSCDYCIMMPMLEYCAPDHFRFLDEVLYVYSIEREDSHVRLNAGREPEWPEMANRPMKAVAS
jgi:glycosyltransferase involved in cell wall biosynthesis